MQYRKKDKNDPSVIFHPFGVVGDWKTNLKIKSAKGVYLELENGQKIIDAISSWWVNVHGHGQKAIADRVHQQLLELDQVIFAGFTHDPAIELSNKLLEMVPGEYEKVMFSDNGSTSVEVALKMAFQYYTNKEQPRKKILALDGSYHGDTFGAMATGARSPFSRAFNDLFFQVDFLPFPDGENDEEVLKLMESYAESEEYAAFIAEPLVQGAGGMRIYSADTLSKLFKTAQKYGMLTIADEVMTGFGRTGKLFACEHLDGVQPDMKCVSKGITGGMFALGLTLINPKVMAEFQSTDPLRRFYHGHSYTGNPVSCAAALASMELLEENETEKQLARIEKKHLEALPQLTSLDSVKSGKVQGTILVLEINAPEQTGYFNPLRDKLYNAFLKKGLLLRPLGNIVYVMPPYCITDEELEYIYKSIGDVSEELVKT